MNYSKELLPQDKAKEILKEFKTEEEYTNFHFKESFDRFHNRTDNSIDLSKFYKKMRNLILLLFVIIYPVMNSLEKPIETKKSENITSKLDVKILKYYNDNQLSDWNILRKNLAESIYKVHGDYNMYDSYCKVLNCESNGWKNSRNPKSSASGLFQCMRATFSDIKTRHGFPIDYNKFSKLSEKGKSTFFASMKARHGFSFTYNDFKKLDESEKFKKYNSLKNEHDIKITFDKFRELSLKEQATYFDEYLSLYKNKARLINTNADQKTRLVYAYLMVLKPSAVGKKWDEAVFKSGDADYAPNKGIPHTNGVIKVSDVYKFCTKKFNK